MANAQKTSNDKTTRATNAAQSNTDAAGTTNQDAGSGSQLSEQVGNIVSGDTSAIKDVLGQAKESTGQVASQAYGIAAKRATSAIDEQKTNLAQGLTSVADSIRQLGETSKNAEQQNVITDITSRYSDSIAGQVEQLSRYLNGKDLRQMTNDVERFARRNPAVFLGGAFALGLLAARFLKSGNPSQALMRREDFESGGVYLPDNFDTQTGSTRGSNFASTDSGTGDFTSGTSGTSDFSAGGAGTEGFTGDISGTTDTTQGTSGTRNTRTGSSNQGG